MVLRRGVMTARRARLLREVWRRWRDCKMLPNYADLSAAAGYSGFGGVSLAIAVLRDQGWLTREFAKQRARVPGPRFVGLDCDGWPLEAIGGRMVISKREQA